MNAKTSLLRGLIIGAIGFAAVKGYSAWANRITPEKIAAGKALFEHDWSVDDPLCGEGDGLGPVFNATSCVACHFQGGVGGGSGNAHNVTAFEIETHRDLDVKAGVVHAHSVHKAFREDKEIAGRLLPRSPPSVEPELPAISSDMSNGCEYVPPPPMAPVEEVIFHELNSPALWGVGLIDQMSTLSISFHNKKRLATRISNEMSGEFGGNRIGMLRTESGVAGKFGWKGQFASLENFVASACAMEIGLTNEMHSQVLPREFKSDEFAKLDMTRKQLDQLVCFVRSLPRPQQILPQDEEELKEVNYGKKLFMEVGCADCHVENLGGINGIYSDFHLYNLELVREAPSSGGASYGDGKAEQEFDLDGDGPHPDQWQTPPLWGVADSAPYFHDGGSPTLRLAINRHLGQAAHSQQKFDDLSNQDQERLIKFLKTLRAPQISTEELEVLASSK